MTDDPRISYPDTVVMPDGTRLSDAWYCEVFRKLFHPRKCDRCKETKNTLGVFIAGTTTYATDVIFGFTVDAAETIIKTLGLFSFCQECFNKLRYNESGVPLSWSEQRKLAKENLNSRTK